MKFKSILLLIAISLALWSCESKPYHNDDWRTVSNGCGKFAIQTSVSFNSERSLDSIRTFIAVKDPSAGWGVFVVGGTAAFTIGERQTVMDRYGEDRTAVDIIWHRGDSLLIKIAPPQLAQYFRNDTMYNCAAGEELILERQSTCDSIVFGHRLKVAAAQLYVDSVKKCHTYH